MSQNAGRTIGFLLLFISLFFLLPAFDTFAAGRAFGLLVKSRDDRNFITAFRGCRDAAELNGDSCTLLGPQGPASPRPQAMALQKAAESNKFNAFAISVVMSGLIADEVAQSVQVPVITFDSPFSPEDASISRSYVGPDNQAFGRDLGRLAKQLLPDGGEVFIMGDLHDPNLAQRVVGLRCELADNPDMKEWQRLSGQGGWRESPRSPWNAGDNVDESMLKLLVVLEEIKPDVFISVGHWPIVDHAAYRKLVSGARAGGVNRKTAVLSGIGDVSAEYQQLLDDGLLQGLVSVDFYEIGRLSYFVMRDVLEGNPVERWNFIPNLIRVGKPVPP